MPTRQPCINTLGKPGIPFLIPSGRLVIRPFNEDDLPEMAEMMCEMRGDGLPEDFMTEKARQWLIRTNALHANEVNMGLFIPGPTLVGRLSACATHDADAQAEWEIGYRVRKAYAKRGYITEAVEAIKPLFRDVVKAKALTASIHNRNEDSIGVVRRAKFAEYPSSNTGHRYFKFKF